MSGKYQVYFIGAGPGDPELITVKGQRMLESADLVIYAGSLVNPVLLEKIKGQTIDSYGMRLEELTSTMVDAVKKGQKVVRLHSGDPSLYGAIIEQIHELAKHDIDVEVVPGVSSIFATAAALGTQLTLKGVSETLIITRPAGETLEEDDLAALSRHGATMAVFLGTCKIEEVMQTVEYPPDTPVAVVYHASWDDQLIIRGTVSDIAARVRAAGLTRSSMILIGGVVDPVHYRRSHLYAPE
ncbi:MAG: precorrin-4 C(11)-methyltransferase [Methanosarcinales archaeon]|nr:precorrin-4 C(11)-methyltransferase [ANME-2 cluster archaeon]MDF1531527.1 precorrin-4 C(11)-methyltransferase [ANME-2 cluster archaeon]MDW7776361.1 precorrin-4 C(11)-methyltransferase [Methanosarcinales archaeon]